jgi:hypothetical protein
MQRNIYNILSSSNTPHLGQYFKSFSRQISFPGIAEKRDDWEQYSQSSRLSFIPRISNAFPSKSFSGICDAFVTHEVMRELGI